MFVKNPDYADLRGIQNSECRVAVIRWCSECALGCDFHAIAWNATSEDAHVSTVAERPLQETCVMKPSEDAAKVMGEAWRISSRLAFCVATVMGKYAAYPQVDDPTYERIHKRIVAGFSHFTGISAGNFCQELRAVISCPAAELLRPERVVDRRGEARELDEVELRLISLADVLRRGARLSHSEFKEILIGLLSWAPEDRAVILGTLENIIRGA